MIVSCMYRRATNSQGVGRMRITPQGASSGGNAVIHAFMYVLYSLYTTVKPIPSQ